MKLLVVIDFEASKGGFLAAARHWATRFAGSVWLVHVEDPDPAFVGYEAGPQETRDAVARDIREHRRLLEAAADDWREAGIETVALVLQGSVVETILAEAAKVGADAIVMGAPTHGRWHDLLLGNEADSLIRKSTCPVLVIPHQPAGTL